jgi:hypothetical protein
MKVEIATVDSIRNNLLSEIKPGKLSALRQNAF